MKDESSFKHTGVRHVGRVAHVRHPVTFVTFWLSQFQPTNSALEFLCAASSIHHEDHMLMRSPVELQVITVFSFCLAQWLSILTFTVPSNITHITCILSSVAM